MNRITTSATVQVLIEVPTRSTWGPNCAVQQVYDQAKEEALETLSRVLYPLGIRIIGTPQLKAITSSSDTPA